MHTITSAQHCILSTSQSIKARLFFVLVTLMVTICFGSDLSAQVFINEIHYDNASTDTGEAVEVAGPAGTDLTGWTIALYNGSATQLNVYATINLAGTIPDQSGGFGTASFTQSGIQNGSPDGLALVDSGAAVIQFLSYEGTFTAASGPASGMTSADIGVAESSSTAVGESLQLTGSGASYGDFTWQSAMANTFGAPNTGQAFTGTPAAPELLVSEFEVTPTAGEFIEIHNPGSSAVDLSNVYLTDATFAGGSVYYYNIVTGANAGGGGFGDFHARFPDGASIPAGGYQTVALNGSDNFVATYGVDPSYELYEDGAADAISDMREALPGSINGQGGLTNGGEVVVLYTWDGANDLVQDLDYALWGDKDEGIDKTGVAIDGPDADADASIYLADTAIASQDVIASGAHASGSTFSRDDPAEGTEAQVDGNGVNGDDETSENLSITWRVALPSPNAETPPPVVELSDIIITEIMQNPSAVSDSNGEWFEVYNSTDTDIDINDWTIADNDNDSHVISNGGPLMVPAGGYVVLGNNTDDTTNGGANVAYSYGSSFFLSNSSDELVLLNGTLTEIDRVEWDNGTTFPDPTGASMSLSGLALDNNVGTNWCESVSRFGLGDRGTPGSENTCVAVIPPFGECGDEATPIHYVQGSGPSSPWNGTAGVIIEGVVVGDFQAPDQLLGFFIQEDDVDVDGDPSTSEGIFVFDDEFGPDVSVGDVVRVQGNVIEFFDLTELTSVINMSDCGVSGVASAAAINLPRASVDDWEATEGMLVTFPQTLFVTNNFTLARFGEVGLSVDAPLDIPTNVVAPGTPALALQDLNDVSRIQLDDGSTIQNRLPLPPYLNADGTRRVGDSITDLTGVLSYGFGSYEVQPTATVDFVTETERPLDPPIVGGLIRVAGFNVLNYFTTLDGDGPICGPSADMGCRGADSTDEFTRQKTKLLAALSALDADVVGLIELENAAGNIPIADLVDGLNAVLGAGTYAFVDTAAIGNDAIRQGIIYQPATVTMQGAFAILDSSVDPAFIDTQNRPALAQTFSENNTGEKFTVAVNHLKSKGSSCDDLGDPDTGDGQGNCNLVRTAAATALVNWLSGDPTASGDSDAIIMGDLNAYAMEDPIMAIIGGGYADLINAFAGTGYADGAYSFSFGGQAGYLDHALASPSLVPEVSGTAIWHINADEPVSLDYNTENNPPALYNPDQFRSSDHDAVVVGLFIDADEDGVWDQIDTCPNTVIPESVPTESLGTNRFALVDDDGVFDTTLPKGKGPKASFDIYDTAGCSCEQIIEAQELGNGHLKFGCSLGEMEEWVELVTMP